MSVHFTHAAIGFFLSPAVECLARPAERRPGNRAAARAALVALVLVCFAIGAPHFGTLAAIMKIRFRRIADRPLAGLAGERQGRDELSVGKRARPLLGAGLRRSRRRRDSHG